MSDATEPGHFCAADCAARWGLIVLFLVTQSSVPHGIC